MVGPLRAEHPSRAASVAAALTRADGARVMRLTVLVGNVYAIDETPRRRSYEGPAYDSLLAQAFAEVPSGHLITGAHLDRNDGSTSPIG